MNMLSARINFRDAHPSATDLFLFKRQRTRIIPETPYFDVKGWYTKENQAYHQQAVFQELQFTCNQDGYIQLDKKIIARLQRWWGSPRHTPCVLSFTTVMDENPALSCSSIKLQEVLKACLANEQAILLHTCFFSFKEHETLLVELAQKQLIQLVFSFGSSQENWRKKWEPGTKMYSERINTLSACTQLGIPCGILLDPVIPGESLQGLYELLRLVSRAGVKWVYYRLWDENKLTYSSNEMPNRHQEQLKKGFISQFTHYCKCFQLNSRLPYWPTLVSTSKVAGPQFLF